MTLAETIDLMKHEAEVLNKEVNEHFLILKNKKKFTCRQYMAVERMRTEIKRNPFIDNFYAYVCNRMLQLSNKY